MDTVVSKHKGDPCFHRVFSPVGKTFTQRSHRKYDMCYHRGRLWLVVAMLADMAWDMVKSGLLLQGFHLKTISQADSMYPAWC